MDDEMTCLIPWCDEELFLDVVSANSLAAPDAVWNMSWRVRCVGNDHIVLTAHEYLERVRDAVDDAEGHGDDPDAESARWWLGDDNHGHDDTQPLPDPVRLRSLLENLGGRDG